MNRRHDNARAGAPARDGGPRRREADSAARFNDNRAQTAREEFFFDAGFNLGLERAAMRLETTANVLNFLASDVRSLKTRLDARGRREIPPSEPEYGPSMPEDKSDPWLNKKVREAKPPTGGRAAAERTAARSSEKKENENG